MSPLLRLTLLCCALLCAAARADDIQQLDTDYWAWRATEQPFSEDDIPRLERPTGFHVDWSATAIADYRRAVEGFEARWQALSPSASASRANEVDYRLVGSAIARARFELDLRRSWQRHPGFYIDQTLGSVYEALLPPAPIEPARQDTVIARLEHIPNTLRAARENLTDVRAPFLALSLDALKEIENRLDRLSQTLTPHFSADRQARLRDAIEAASHALVGYRDWLQTQRAQARPDTAIGADAYAYFLHNVALLSSPPGTMLDLARAEWSRAVAFEAVEDNRLRDTPAATLFANSDAQVAAEAEQEGAVRRFLVAQHLLSVPDDVAHYRNLLLPDYLEPLAFLGVSDDLTGPSRLRDNATSYIREPRPDLPYFYLSTARDPRPIIVHEGVPGHYFQLALGWRHPDPVRRHYYDSAANEGIGFYAEEMMLQAGLFDDRPRTRATIANFMRLRALRVEVDVKLALGQFTLQQAAEYLEHTVPMDAATALEEAASFAATPGQAISYQIGKTQILNLLADVRRREGADFSLQRFHDRLWREGNVPIALTRYEWLGDASEIPTPLPMPTVTP
jgi:Bacterial protein of unknown function (DUF885)